MRDLLVVIAEALRAALAGLRRSRPTERTSSSKGCSIGCVLAHLLTSYTVLVLPAALGTIAFLHRALDFYERMERRRRRRSLARGREASARLGGRARRSQSA